MIHDLQGLLVVLAIFVLFALIGWVADTRNN